MEKNYKILEPEPVASSMKIGNRIYALIAFCLGLLALVSGISIWQMNRNSAEIKGISQRDIPLTEDLTQITIHQLEQAINFERAFRAGEVMNEHPIAKEEFNMAVRIFKGLTSEVEREFDAIKAITVRSLDTAKSTEAGEEYQSVLTILGKLDAEHEEYDRLARRAFKLIEAGKIKAALDLLPSIEVREENLDKQLENMLIRVSGFTRRSIEMAGENEDFAQILLVLLTNTALIIGTGAAVIMVRRRISKPLREIVTGLDALSAGDMSVDVKIYRDDEIGAVARSYLTFKHSLMKLKRRGEQLHLSEQRFKDIAEVSSDWFWECDENMRFTDLSERFMQVTGVTKEKIVDKTRHEIGTDSIVDWDTHFADLEARRPFRDFSYSMKDDNGKTRHWVTSGRPVYDAEGNFKGYHGTGTDRTKEVRIQGELVRHRDHLQEMVDTATQELKLQAVELREALAKEKELNELQKQFVTMASHEFRTPLAIIDSTAQRLKKSADSITSGDVLMRVDKIRNAVQRMTKLMESTLNAARLEEGKIAVEIGYCNVKKAVRHACSSLQELAKNHNITYEFSDLPMAIKADRNALDQVLINLLSNAIKYSPDAPDVLVKAYVEGENIVIQVCDHGLGIDEDDLPNMFSRFFRAKTSVGISGTGIGLNLAQTLVEMHDGSISIRSKLGKGSTFTVRLPIAGPSQVVQAA